MRFSLKLSLLFGTMAVAVALLLIFGRTTLAGKTITQGDVAIIERDELWEERLYLIGGLLGGLGIVVVFVGVAGTRSTRSRDAPR